MTNGERPKRFSLAEVHPGVGNFCIFVFTVVASATIISSFLTELVNPVLHTRGEVANYTIRAPHDSLVEDTAGTGHRRENAEREVSQVFVFSPPRPGKITEELIRDFREVAPWLEKGAPLQPEEIAKARIEIERRFTANFSGREWEVLLSPSRWQPLGEALEQILNPILRRGIVSDKRMLEEILAHSSGAVEREEGSEKEIDLRSASSMYSIAEALAVAKASIPAGGFQRSREFDLVVEKLLPAVTGPNVVFDSAETERRIKTARDAISPIYHFEKRGEVILRAGDVITEVQERRLIQLHRELYAENLFRSWCGYALLGALVLLTLVAFVRNFWAELHFSPRDYLLVSVTLLCSLFLLQLFSILANSLSSAFLYFDPGTFALLTPVAAGGIMLQVTLGVPGVTLFMMSFAILTGVFLENSWIMLVLIVLGNIVGAVSVRRCTRRSTFIRAGLRVSMVNVLLVISFFLLQTEFSLPELASRIIWAFAGGLLSGILGAGLIPIAEFLGGYVTDIRLLELASLDQPLLRELSVQAPGTWNHSMVVGQMSEAAAEAIGANPVLARVGAYYHDLGKARKPAYFVENQSVDNRHDRLTPSMSALIIKSHVKEGMDMADEHHMPHAIMDFISQHHGTSLIEYFYEKALKEAQEDEIVEEGHFRYPGPRPQTKEIGVMMLADAVEATSRTLVDPVPAKLQGLVQKMINKVFASGQLDESSLTLKDLHLIAKTFTRVLSAIYHRRVEYSEPSEKIREGKGGKSPKEDHEQSPAGEIKREAGALKKNGSRSNGEAEGEARPGEDTPRTGDQTDGKETLKRLGM